MMSEKKWLVYMYTFPNGKVYIGQTSKTIDKRIGGRNCIGYKKCPIVYNAMLKYGIDNVVKDVLYDGLCSKLANEIEMALIEAYNSTDDRFGYNVTKGGDGGLGTKHSEESLLKMRGENHRLFGKFGSEHPQSKRIMCTTTKQIFGGAAEASRDTGINISAICNAANGKAKYGGTLNNTPLQWSYVDEFDNPYVKFDPYLEIDNNRPRKVQCIETGLIFNSQSDASKFYNLGTGNLSRTLGGKHKYCGKLADGTRLTWRVLDEK